MERWPARSRRRFIHSGVDAAAFTLRITRPAKRPQPAGAEILTGNAASFCLGTGRVAGGVSFVPVSAATSRATPSTERQSARFGVSLIVRTLSSRSST